MTAEIQRLRVNEEKHDLFVVFDAAIGYVQCAPDKSLPGIYCEAASVDSWEALASVLTPERVQRLHELGFTDPGRVPNYWKEYPDGQFDETSVARELLTVLHDAYGYTGLPALSVTTEDGKRR